MNLLLGIGKEEVNITRQQELDVVKLLALLIMSIVHCFEDLFYGNKGILFSLFHIYLNYTLCATVFMCSMGAGISYSKNNSANELIKRGISLLFSGLLLNTFRTLIEYDLTALLTGEKIWLIGNVWVLGVDILQFSGLSFILTGLLKKLKLNEIKILIFAVLLSILGRALIGVETGNFMIDSLLGYFWGTNTESYFPLFHWYIYVAGGLAFASMLKRASNKKRFYLPLIIVGFIAFVMFVVRNNFLVPEEYNYFSKETYYTWVSPVNSIPLLFIFMGYCGVVFMVTGRMELSNVRKTTENITRIYIIHWIIICILNFLLALKIIPWIKNELIVVIVGLLIFTVSMLLAEKYRSNIKPSVDNWISNKRTQVRMVIVVVVLTLFFSGIIVHNNYFPNIDYPTFVNDYNEDIFRSAND